MYICKKKHMLKIGLIGVGHLGKIHLRLIQELSDQYELIGIYDSNTEHAQAVAKEFDCASFESVEELIDLVDCVDIVTPTIAHFDLASRSEEHTSELQS